jgi:hypothetical protein
VAVSRLDNRIALCGISVATQLPHNPRLKLLRFSERRLSWRITALSQKCFSTTKPCPNRNRSRKTPEYLPTALPTLTTRKLGPDPHGNALRVDLQKQLDGYWLPTHAETELHLDVLNATLHETSSLQFSDYIE